jgi:hypothetical protein
LRFEAPQQKRNTDRASRHTLDGGLRKPLMTIIGRVHSTGARHSPRAIRNKAQARRSSADGTGFLLSEDT